MRTFLRTFFIVALSTAWVHADVKLPAIISDHMVLQAGLPAPIWGWADPGEKVTVTVGGQTQTAVADALGKWKVTLENLKTNAEPQTLVVAGKNQLQINDVLVGEVWLGSGQSNMAMLVRSCLEYDKEQAAAKHPTLRMFTVARNSQLKPVDDCQGEWVVCSPETVGAFSATAYFFGRDLQAALKVPVGLINSSWGGTKIEAWTSIPAQEKLAAYPLIQAHWDALKAKPWDQAKEDAKYQTALAQWKIEVAAAKKAGKPQPRGLQPPVEPRLQQNHPGNLFNGMIEPLIPYAFRGAIWYQGEGNSAQLWKEAYGDQLRTLIAEWRLRFGHDFPFAWVQLPDFKAPQQNPVEATQTWPIIREQMLKTLAVPKTGMAVALGLGEEKDIHPKNKQGIGFRLSRWALHDVYQQEGPAGGPLPVEHRLSGDGIVVTFKNTDGGLKSRDGGPLKGFAIAGPDLKFVWAKAEIQGNTVHVSSPDVKQPIAVRYAWADNPIWSLENGAGLPATPFRTDDIKISE